MTAVLPVRTPYGRGHAVAIVAFTALTLAVTGAPSALADDEPPGSFEENTKAPVELNKDDPDLKKVDGATLAEPKVLDIKSVVESDGAERREDSNGKIKFALQSEVLFGKDSSKLTSKADARIAKIAKEIEQEGATRVNVFGYTDNLGSFAHGEVLSKERAQAVHKKLSKKLDSGITYKIRGYSEDYPIASNATEAGRKKNRRVEVSFPRGD